MEKYFTIVSDGSCDLPEEIVKEKESGEVHFLASFDGKEYKKEGVEIRLEDFYGKMVAESNVFPLTAAPSPNDYYEVFKEKAKEGKYILCICISTKLSSSMQSAEIAAKMLAEKYPDIQVKIIDSLACTLMQGLYVLEACRLRDLGYTLKDSIERMNQLTDTQRIFFTVGNLEYLEHGGRIGKVASIAGKLLNVKPLITLKDGEIYSPGLKRGRKKSMAGTIDLLLDYMEENGYTPENCSLVIGYCYGYEEAESFQKMLMQSLEEKFGTTETVPIHRIGATIGVHTGPYAIGIGIIRRSDMV